MRSHVYVKLLIGHRVGDWNNLESLCRQLATRAREQYERDGVGDGLHGQIERVYLDLVAQLLKLQKRSNEIGAVRCEIAESCARHADGIVAAAWPGARGVAAHFVRQSLELYRKAGVNTARVEELRRKLEELQRAAVAEMRPVKVPLSFGDLPTQARKFVAGKPPESAVLALCSLHDPPTELELQEQLRVKLEHSPIYSFLPARYVGPRGTSVVGHGGVDEAKRDDAAYQIELRRAAYEHQIHIGCAVLAPAAQQLACEHGLSADFFEAMIQRTAFVPEARLASFSRGVAAGLHGDFELAATVLFPQLEHCVRELFFHLGKVTTILQSNGAQNEWDLNRLLTHSTASEIFAPDLLFDLRCLLIEKAGGNLRNRLAHGLMDDHIDLGGKVYLWWTCLRLALLPFLELAEPTEESGDAIGSRLLAHEEP